MGGGRHAHMLFINFRKIAEGVKSAFFSAFADVILSAGQECASMAAPD